MPSNEQFLHLRLKHFTSAYSYILLFVNCNYNFYIIVLVRSTELGFVPGILRLKINYYY